ncbi:DUF4124 domain-containing protein [Vibrio sp. TRT 21S02]|uniref:DUF4124 domain-containing protein n=1 Tax=Vibrio sp. TRT 21S02 TaxID=3418507 RepID=UPI003CEC5DA4
MKFPPFLLGLTLIYTAAVQAQTVYTWVDDNGTIHFSDSPQAQKAKALNLPKYDSPAPAPEFEHSEPVQEPSTEDSHVNNEKSTQLISVSIASPEHDSAIRSNAGRLMINGEINRKLAIGEQLQLIMDGRKYGAPINQPTWELKNVDRGTHIFAIQVIRDGKLIASSSPITVHLQRASVK